MRVRFNYRDGTSEVIDGVLRNSVVTFGDGEGRFSMESNVLIDYRLKNLLSFEIMADKAGL